MPPDSNTTGASAPNTTSSNRSHQSPTDLPGSGAVARGRRIAGTFLHSAAFIAIVAVVETWIATVLLGVALTPAPIVVGLIAFAVYATDRVADAETDIPSNPVQAAYARKHGDVLATAAALAYALAVALALLGGPLALALTLLPGLAWFGYASSWLPTVASWLPATSGRVPRLKDVLVLNSGVVAFAWAAALTFLPLAFAGDSGNALAVAVVFAYFLLRSFVDVEVPNVRDVAADAAIGVETLATELGVDRTRRVLYAVDLGVVVMLLAAAHVDLLAMVHAGALLAGVAVSLGVTALVGRAENVRLLAVAPECSYLVAAIALLVVGP